MLSFTVDRFGQDGYTSGIAGHSLAMRILLWAWQISHHLGGGCALLLGFSEVGHRCIRQHTKDTTKS